jgi:anaerobic magnesium-protoporphyrin IX monomethyl ester cyclase
MPKKYVCLVNPRDTVVEDPAWDEPLGLLYLGAVLERAGLEVEVVDLNFHKNFELLKRSTANVFGLYCSSSLLESCLRVNEYLKNERPEALRIVGGPHPTCAPYEIAQYFDKVVVGEGEKTIIEILEGKWIGKLAHCPPIEDLDTIPFPARNLIPIRQYHRRVGGQISTGIITARGCPFNCAFCSKVWRKVRFRTAENILGEVKECIDKYDIRAFSVRDDTFTLNRKRLFKILRGFKKLNVVWRCLTRTDQVDEDVLKRMKEAGCTQIVYGIESGNQQILNNLRKGTTVEQNAKAIRLTKKARIHVKAAVIVGSPGETWQTVKDTVKFIENNLPDEGIVCIFTPYPGSPVWSDPEKFKVKILTRDVSKYAAVGSGMKGNVVVETEKMTRKDIGEAHSMVLERFKQLGLVGMGET